MAKKKSEAATGIVQPGRQAKKELKQEPTFHVQLTEEQKLAKAVALENRITIFTGKAGTSKTLLSCNIALDLLQKGRVNKIIVTRPMVDVGESMGYLPGEGFSFTEGKMAPYLAPIMQAFYKLKDKKVIDKWIEDGKIIIVPIQFVRGLNFEDCAVLVDEAQNLTTKQLKALVTRICKDAYMFFTSDLAQIDLVKPTTSAGPIFKIIMRRPGVGSFELTQNFRDPLALQLLEDIETEEAKEMKIAA